MNSDGMKEVYFDQYCDSCVHKRLSEDKEPCHSCLQELANQYSHRPVKWKEKPKW